MRNFWKRLFFFRCFSSFFVSTIRKFEKKAFKLFREVFCYFAAKTLINFWDSEGKISGIWAKTFRQRPHYCIFYVQRNSLGLTISYKTLFWLWVKMFRSLKEQSSVVSSKQKSAYAKSISLLFFHKNIVVFVGTSSRKFWDFQRKSLIFGGKCFGNVLKSDFYLTRGTLWAKCFEVFCEYKVCLLTVSERLFDPQQKFPSKFSKVHSVCQEEQIGGIL